MLQSAVMFKDVPIQAWLLLLVAFAVYAPALYIFRYLTETPSRQDIARPSPDFSWRSAAQFWQSFFFVVALLAFSLFIFTPTARTLAKSAFFWPTLIFLFGLWAACTVPWGIHKGRIQPIIRGVDWAFEQETQPKRFWGAALWNGLIGGFGLYLGATAALDAPVQQDRDKCHNYQDRVKASEAILACDALLKREDGRVDKADILLARGNGYFALENYVQAERDYAASARLDPESSAIWYNLGLVSTRLNNSDLAVRHYGKSIANDRTNSDAFLNRGLIFLDMGKIDHAIADLTEAAKLDPKNAVPIANRGLAHAWKGERKKALSDFQQVDALDPSNIVVLHGRALLSLRAGNRHAAIEQLSAAIAHDQNDVWALGLRGDIYESLGDYDRSQADTDRLLRINKQAK